MITIVLKMIQPFARHSTHCETLPARLLAVWTFARSRW